MSEERTAVTLRQRAEALALRAGVKFAQSLPYDAIRPVASVLGGLVSACDPRGREVGIANVEAAFPGRFDAAAKRRIVRGSYATFARTMFELFWARHLDRKFVEERIIFEGWDRDYCRKDPSKPAIYACLHFSNFEWLALVGSFTIQPGPVIAQRFRNPLLGPVFDSLRKATGNEVIPQERAMIRMLKFLKNGGKFGMLCDLNIDPREGSVLIESFGGLLSSVTPAHIALAQRTGAAVVPVECRPHPGKAYKIIHHEPIECPPGEPLGPLVQRCWDVLERGIHEHPECWLWAYKHWRFKPQGASPRYPFYANQAKRFDKLVRARAMA